MRGESSWGMILNSPSEGSKSCSKQPPAHDPESRDGVLEIMRVL